MDDLICRAKALQEHILGMDSGSGDAALIGDLVERLEAVTQERDEWQDRAAVAVRGRKSAEAALALYRSEDPEPFDLAMAAQYILDHLPDYLAHPSWDALLEESENGSDEDVCIRAWLTNIVARPVLTPAEILAQIAAQEAEPAPMTPVIARGGHEI